MTSVIATEPSTGQKVQVSTKGFPDGTMLSDDPRVALVLRSDDGKYVHGHFELDVTSANILGEELRRAAEKANNQEETNS